MKKGIGFPLARLLASVMFTLLLLTACGTDTTNPPASNTPDFSLSVSGALSAVQGAQTQTDISITRTNGFSEAINLSVSGLPTGVTSTFTPNPRDGASSVLNLAVASSVAPGDYTMTLVGSAGNIEKTTPLILTVTATSPSPTPPSPTPSPPIINAVAIQGNGSSTQVRQGAGVITVGVAGSGLKDISSATLGTLSGTVVTNNDKAASLTFTIPSGAEVGPQTLRLETPFGVIEQEEAVVISKITVSNTGDDATGKGTPNKPFKTMSFAVGQAGSGDTVRLLDGTYNEAGGENLPFNFPSGVTLTLEGESETGTIIEGPGVFHCFIIDDSDVAISSMTIKNCSRGVNPQGTVKVTISNVTLNENAVGLFIEDTAQVTMENSTVENSNVAGVFVLDGDSRLEIRGGSISRNGTEGIDTIQSPLGVLRLEGVTLDSNATSGLLLRTEGTVEIVDSVIRNNGDAGVEVRDLPALVNLGDGARAGNNTITNNVDFQLSDKRPASSVVITAHGNTIGGGSDTTGEQIAGPAGSSSGTSWQITTEGNVIDFGL